MNALLKINRFSFLNEKKKILKNQSGLGWCGSVDWAPAWEPKSPWFDSQSGHMPGFQAMSPVGGM